MHQALNTVVRMEPNSRYPFNSRSFYTNEGMRPIGGGILLWRGYFQSVRPGIGRMLINIDISTAAMYKHGRLIDLCLDFLGIPAGNVVSLAPTRGFPFREQIRLNHFLRGLMVTMPYRQRSIRIAKLSRRGACDETFKLDGKETTVAEYFKDHHNHPLMYPEVVCAVVSLSKHAIHFN